MLQLGFIGAGTVGTALARRLQARGFTIVAVSSRSAASVERFTRMVPGAQAALSPQEVADAAELIVITTPDDVIAPVAASLSWRAGQSVVHCSGALSKDIFLPLTTSGVHIGSLHPLQTFGDIEQAVANLSGSTFALEADEPLLTTLKEFAQALDGHYIELQAHEKVLYHAAAVVASNYLVTITRLATDLWAACGISNDDAMHALLPLLKGTLNNIEQIGLPGCLTGPIARGDAETVQRHLETLQQACPTVLSTYRELGLQTIPIAMDKGTIDRQQATALTQLLHSENPSRSEAPCQEQ